MYSEAAMETTNGFTNGLARYIIGSEGYDTLLEAEKMGVQIRDEQDEFKGSMFRDEETKLLFAYDIDSGGKLDGFAAINVAMHDFLTSCIVDAHHLTFIALNM